LTVYGATRNDFIVRYRARESFSVAGRLVAKDEVLERNDPLVSHVLSSRPDLLLVWVKKEV
jgi:hypothetical protein